MPICLIAGCTPETQPTETVTSVDHSTYNTILQACVDTQGLVDYNLMRTNYYNDLQNYLDNIGRINADNLPRRRQKITFWINAYNALVLQQVLDLNPQHSATREDSLFFQRRDYFIAGKKRSLNEILNQIILTQFNEPRVFAALCDSTLSSVPLRPEAYQPDMLAAQLEHQCRIWIAGKNHNQLDQNQNCLYLSATFKNFSQHFDRLFDNPRNFFQKYTPDPTEQQYLNSHPDLTVIYLPYDWTLNKKK
ncbi:MAG: DUF547 domain-containing protein [Planctomycetes bacterium]|nr:DUF547 domain-containing protein [Planctomycetota bacterium]